MALLFNLLFRGKATSTHHKLALDALRLLKRYDADEWQNVFLAEVDAYLRGSKAPDDEFRDFRNHVLHVRENFWGGAITAAEEWYRKTVQALTKRDWPEAVYNAGVLSHYFTDPFHPFHTGQSEREMIVHRAAEWSITKTYEELQSVLTKEAGGYPDVKLPAGDNWLATLIRQGAEEANKHYDFLIDHYNFDIGVKNPAGGFDREGKLVIARLIGLATVSFARVLDKAIAEAGVLVPHVVVSFQTFFESMSAPMRAVAKKKLDVQERMVLEAMYLEYKQTGKVIEHLAEADKVVRRLYAEEVLKISLTDLDKRPAGAVGTKYTGPLPAAPAAAEKQSSPPAKEKADPITSAPVSASPKSSPKRDDLNAPKLAPLTVAKDSRSDAASANEASDAAKATTGEKPRSSHVSLDSPLVDAPSIGPKTSERFTPLGIRTIGQFLTASPDMVAQSLKVSHITAQVVKEWQHQARLVVDIPRLRGHDAQLLVGVGIHSADDLARSNARELLELVKDYAESAEGKRVLRDAKPPDLVEVSQWVVAAKKTRVAKAA